MSRRTDPVLLAVLSNAFEGIVREMTTGLLRSARSSVINTARDFSCSILTADNQLLAAAEGAPVHVFGSELLGAAMSELHHDLQRGDAFLHNDPYRGNSHAADHSLLVPIFIGGTHMFTAVAKAHQASSAVLRRLRRFRSRTAVDKKPSVQLPKRRTASSRRTGNAGKSTGLPCKSTALRRSCEPR